MFLIYWKYAEVEVPALACDRNIWRSGQATRISVRTADWKRLDETSVRIRVQSRLPGIKTVTVVLNYDDPRPVNNQYVVNVRLPPV